MTDDNTPPRPSINFDDIALPQDFDNLLHAKTVLTEIPLRKPYKERWIRTHPTWRQDASVLKLKGDRKGEVTYILTKDVVPALLARGLVGGCTFVPAIDRHYATMFLWPLRQPFSDRPDRWAQSAIEIAQRARTRWVQVHADHSLSVYICHELPDTDEPTWPDLPWPELRQLAFRDHVIDSLAHPVVQQILYGR